MSFLGRTIQVVKDLSLDEQWYLYQKARDLKEALRQGRDPGPLRLAKPDTGVYLMFLEDSTRTKESFRNAAIFHGMKVNDFDVRSSSFQKKENLTDTVKMLLGYSAHSLFVFRTKQEGVCRWLEQSMGRYAQRAGLPTPSFINAGDGRHEHPTQEFLDEFSFLEHLDWNRDHIHLALVGDLFHGRTVHSKVDGLKIFRSVEVDLVAPPEIAMPPHYVRGLEAAGFQVRIFSSIDEYVAQKHLARTWYFTRLQLERMGDHILQRAAELRKAVTFRKDLMAAMPPGTRFFHPLPRHSETPTIPSFLDDTDFNGWDEQSRNGYFTRIVAMGMLAGGIGDDFEGEGLNLHPRDEDFIEEAPLRSHHKPEYKVGIRPVDNGLVIDHIGLGHSPAQIWDHIAKIRAILDLNVVSSQGVYQSENRQHHKGVISIPDLLDLDEKKLKMLAAIAPNCTLNLVKSSQVHKKYRLRMPPRVYKLEGLRCRNEDCISNPKHFEPMFPEFHRHQGDGFICHYCETPHRYQEIWS